MLSQLNKFIVTHNGFDQLNIMSETQLADQFLYQCSLKANPDVRVSSRKRVHFVIDINQGSYANDIVTIDATSQLNGAEGFGSLKDAYIVVPYKVSMKNGATAQTAAANRLCMGLKCGAFNVIDGLSLELNGKSILSMTDYKLFWNNLRAQSSMSTQFVDKHGADTFIYPDSAQSVLYTPTGTPTANGDGYSNNIVYRSGFTASASPAGATTPNDGFLKRLLANPPAAGADFTAAWPSVGQTAASTTIANQTARGAFVAGASTANAIMGTRIYMLKIKLTDLHPIFAELDLMANSQVRMRFKVNQGSSAVAVDASKNMTLTSTTLSSGQTCPVMIASAATGNPMAGVLAASAPLTVVWGAVTNYLEPTVDGYH
ncbi:hypothetical protein PC110_g18096 [Phytophthora cactorum]|uniref:Uncharacterized protein n=1 Tax=Phytophthora cactorum TaxID=29920 RepID=A0A329RML1_9STRA|nr:hypothetical protein PC110_g18096 [Phytophthora cactorum]